MKACLSVFKMQIVLAENQRQRAELNESKIYTPMLHKLQKDSARKERIASVAIAEGAHETLTIPSELLKLFLDRESIQ